EANPDHPLTQEDHELTQILVSYASEAVHLLQALDRVSWSEARLRDIIDHSPSLISLQDLAGRFLIVNQRFEEWHGHRHQDVVGKTANDILSANAARLYGPGGDQAGNGEQMVDEEIEISFADGSLHSLLMTRFPVRAGDGRLIGIGTIATDVTERRNAEEHLRQAQKMEALGQLTGGVAHDFNNLWAVIYGNLSLIGHDLQGPPELLELLEDASAATQAGADLTHRLLAFGRRQTLHPQPTDTRELLVKMFRVLQRTLGEAIVIEAGLNDELWPIEVDRSQLETSLLNLALNARDAMPEGGALRIAAQNVTRDGDVASGPFVMITVSDTGAGMAADVLARAVQPFFTTKSVGRGSGLGLSMVYGFAQ
ncbi:MAG: PAS domain S-box protein, partial [Nitrospirota bacterium]|nr:PAS domain S-box protein [Nitrospirota bacterium]